MLSDQAEAISRQKSGTHYYELSDGRIIASVYSPTSNGGWVATFEDVTERRLAEAQIMHMARHDALTDLPNRVLFREKMEQALDRGDKLAVLFLDLDRFKTVNDTLGHPVGDALLCAVTKRLQDAVRGSDTVARLGGDEFAIVQAGARPTDATELAARIIEAVSQPFDVLGHQVVIGASVGIAIAPTDGREPDQLLRNADMALYRAKSERPRQLSLLPAGDGRADAGAPCARSSICARRITRRRVRGPLPADHRGRASARSAASRRWCAGTIRSAASISPGRSSFRSPRKSA